MNEELQQWVEQVTGTRVTNAERIFSGGSRQTILVDTLSSDGNPLPLVLKWEPGVGSHAGTDFSLEREYVVYRALENSAVPVPKAYGISDDGNALLMERLPGRPDLAGYSAESLDALAGHFMDCLVALHQLDLNDLDLPGFGRPRSGEDSALMELVRWEALARERTANDDPLVRYALAWLRSHAPNQDVKPVLVQGDTGPGNMMADGERVAGLIDWEFSHIGDPMDDIAWVRSRTRNRGAFGPHFEKALARYAERSGNVLDPERLAYYDVLVTIRHIVTTAMAIHKGGGAMGFAGYLYAQQNMMRNLGPALLHAAGYSPHQPTDLPAPAETSRSAYYDRVLQDLNHTVRPQIDDKAVKVTLNGVNFLVNWLKMCDQIGPALDELDRSDQLATFGRTIEPAELLTLADQQGQDADESLLRYLSRRVDRNVALWNFDPRAR